MKPEADTSTAPEATNDEAAVSTAEPSAEATATEPNSESAEAGDQEPEGSDSDPTDPVEPSASTPPRLSAVQRGALRLLGKGDLIARLERVESEVSRLTAENRELTLSLTNLQEETPKQIKAAKKGRENEVSKGVSSELEKIGIDAEAAPAQLGVESAEEITTKAEAQKAFAEAKTPKEKRAIYDKHKALLY